mmetsp:Transcript_49821/g.159345  ORF Transcript_49821/g.159345 Transcript_49821/m.159345 type:complete len:296 (+) Transcript_49821:2039-2926(+)
MPETGSVASDRSSRRVLSKPCGSSAQSCSRGSSNASARCAGATGSGPPRLPRKRNRPSARASRCSKRALVSTGPTFGGCSSRRAGARRSQSRPRSSRPPSSCARAARKPEASARFSSLWSERPLTTVSKQLSSASPASVTRQCCSTARPSSMKPRRTAAFSAHRAAEGPRGSLSTAQRASAVWALVSASHSALRSSRGSDLPPRGAAGPAAGPSGHLPPGPSTAARPPLPAWLLYSRKRPARVSGVARGAAVLRWSASTATIHSRQAPQDAATAREPSLKSPWRRSRASAVQTPG